MGIKRRKQSPVLLPMPLAHREEEAYDAALAKVEETGSEAERSEARFIREQRVLHASYVHVCDKLEQYSVNMRAKEEPLVPLRFPIRLTQKTRESVENGMFRSFHRFLQDLHAAVMSQHEGGVDDAATNVEAFLTRVTNVLTLESCRILDGTATAQQARGVCVSYIEKCRRDTVHLECEHLASLDRACNAVIGCLRRFSQESSKISKDVAVRMRSFLRTNQRRGLREAAVRMGEERQLRGIVETHTWLHGGDMDDARVCRVHALLVLTHDDLVHSLLWHCRRIAWLRSMNSANHCWCGLTVGPCVDGILLHAPAHQRVFAGGERLYIAPERLEVPFVCYLSAVSVANIVLDLLRERRLPLNRISGAYANRVLTCDFCKYETAAQNILCDTLQPWLERVTA